MQIAIIGGGAAGCFAAIQIKQRLPHAIVTVYESQQRALAKVAITGGGRCNLSNTFASVKSLESVYPRGFRLLKRLFHVFDHRNTFEWFEKQGVKLTIQPDNCVFPASQDAMQVVNTLLQLMQRTGVVLKTGHRLSSLSRHTPGNYEGESPRYRLNFANEALTPREADAVLVTTGGSPRESGLNFLHPLELDTITPVPSLFSLCLPSHPITALMGTVVESVTASLSGTRLKAYGPLLITHWGMSGPAILKLSSLAARILADNNYKGTIVLNWFGEDKENTVASELSKLAESHPQKQLQNVYPERFNSRLWNELLGRCSLRPNQRWIELGNKSIHRMAAILTNDRYDIDGKNRFKEEFVTCGGIALSNLKPSTLECRQHPRLYFAGEVLDVDAITGGFNLQAAWTMGYVAAHALCDNLSSASKD